MSGAHFVDDISRHRGQVSLGIIRYNKILLVLPVLFRLMKNFNENLRKDKEYLNYTAIILDS